MCVVPFVLQFSTSLLSSLNLYLGIPQGPLLVGTILYVGWTNWLAVGFGGWVSMTAFSPLLLCLLEIPLRMHWRHRKRSLASLRLLGGEDDLLVLSRSVLHSKSWVLLLYCRCRILGHRCFTPVTFILARAGQESMTAEVAATSRESSHLPPGESMRFRLSPYVAFL